MLKGFKDFILRGNIVELAIAVVIGTAFAAIVTAFTKSIISPIIAVFGGNSVTGLAFYLNPNNPATLVDFGGLLTAIVTFLITAAVVYCSSRSATCCKPRTPPQPVTRRAPMSRRQISDVCCRPPDDLSIVMRRAIVLVPSVGRSGRLRRIALIAGDLGQDLTENAVQFGPIGRDRNCSRVQDRFRNPGFGGGRPAVSRYLHACQPASSDSRRKRS